MTTVDTALLKHRVQLIYKAMLRRCHVPRASTGQHHARKDHREPTCHEMLAGVLLRGGQHHVVCHGVA